LTATGKSRNADNLIVTERGGQINEGGGTWLRTTQSQEFIAAYSKRQICLLTDLVIVKHSGDANGTWMQEDAALEFVRWHPLDGCHLHLLGLLVVCLSLINRSVIHLVADPMRKEKRIGNIKLFILWGSFYIIALGETFANNNKHP
jgi:hypothetical protein